MTFSQPSTSQWQRLLKNAGTWAGSFTQISPKGQILSDVRTEVELTPSADDSAMHQEVRRYPTDDEPKIQTLDYRSLNRATRFFEDGAFSQGSMQWGPFSSFGAELGLIAGRRRLRLVQLFKQNKLKPITLIREGLKGVESAERPPLMLTDLIGTWEGKSVTQFADLQPEQTSNCRLIVEQTESDRIRQTIQIPSMPTISSEGRVEGDRILFQGGAQSIQVLLLPDGASSTCPTTITPRAPLFLEVGWLLDSYTRQRLVRSYDKSGAWVSLTLVTEQKV